MIPLIKSRTCASAVLTRSLLFPYLRPSSIKRKCATSQVRLDTPTMMASETAAKADGKSGERIPFPKYPRSVSDTCLPFLVLLLLAFFGPCEERKNPFTSVSGGGLLLREMHGFKRRIHACYVRSPIPSTPSRASGERPLPL